MTKEVISHGPHGWLWQLCDFGSDSVFTIIGFVR